MPFDIRDLRTERVTDNTKYFFDANIWLCVLSTQFTLRGNTNDYLNFFEAVAKHTKNTKVLMTSFLLSETVNRYLREISMKKFARTKGDAEPLHSSYFKQKYRADAQFAIDYQSVCDDIKAYHSALEFISDDFGTFRVKDILKSPDSNLDFNDSLAVKLALKHNYVIVTDDKDFWVEGVKVITRNNDLLNKMKAETAKTGI